MDNFYLAIIVLASCALFAYMILGVRKRPQKSDATAMTVFEIINENGKLESIIITDGTGKTIYTTQKNDLPHGTYEMREVRPDPGYLIDNTWQENHKNGMLNLGKERF